MTHHLAVMLGLGCWLGSIASLVAPYIRTTPEFLHWFPLSVCVVGFVAGYFISRKLGVRS